MGTITVLVTKNTPIMSIKFRAIPRRNPQDVTQLPKYYAKAVGAGITDMERLAELISYQSTVTEADCYAVLMALEHNIISELAQGRIVQLAHLGHFQIGISSEARNTPDEITPSCIVKNRILFRPGRRFRNLLKMVEYLKIK
jgi:predicted histone-like DNA-binding protein